MSRVRLDRLLRLGARCATRRPDPATGSGADACGSARAVRAAPPALFVVSALLAAFTLSAQEPAAIQAAQPRTVEQGGDAQSEFVWLEGEDAVVHSFNQHGWYSESDVRTDLMSPGTPGDPSSSGAWLAHYSNRGLTAEASYDFEVTTGGPYTLWLRASQYQVRMWYSLDEGERTWIDLESDPRERINLTSPRRPDLRFLAWIEVGELELAPGRHNLTFGLAHHPLRQPDEVHGGIDAICIENTHSWAPTGALKPSLGPPPERQPDEWYAFVPGKVAPEDDIVTDVSYLLDAPAGSHGPLRRDADRLAFADGTPARFLGVGARVPATPELMVATADYLARHGVNLVRLHPVQAVVGLLLTDPDSGRRVLDEKRLEVLDRWFYALKNRGIYMDWSPVYPHVITADDGYPEDLYDELPDRGAGKSTSGYVNFMRQLQDAEWTWLRALLLHRNPYTGLRYADDPALAILEIHNEDSVFWHAPLNTLADGTDAPLHTAQLKRMWMEWLRRKYATDNELLATWGPVGSGSRPGDSLANPDMPIYGAWEMAADGPARNKAEAARMGDFIRFLAETQREYFSRRGRELRDLGFRGVTVSTAWRAGGPAANAANLWTDDAMDAIDRHAYFGGPDRSSDVHRILPGAVRNGAHVRDIGGGILSVGFQQIEDRPFFVSEWNQNPPNQWKAEIAPLMTYYGLGLQGWDAVIHFNSSHPRLESGWPDESSYASDTPHYMGQFPALAIAVHGSHVREGGTAAARRVPLDAAFRGLDVFTQDMEGIGYDGGEPGGNLRTPLDTIAMGRVSTLIRPDAAPAERSDWESHWNDDHTALTSDSGELEWHTDGYVVVRTSKSQGVIGFAGGHTIELPAATVEVTTTFASLLITALDDRPLSSSGRVLVTALSRDRQTGARYSEDGTELLSLGGPPLLLEPVQAAIQWRGAPIASVRVLDHRGAATQHLVPARANTFVIDGRYATHYYEILTDAYMPPTAMPPTATATATATPTMTSSPTPVLSHRALVPIAGTGSRSRPQHPNPALAEKVWRASERLLEEYPPQHYFPAYGEDMSGASAEAARRNVVRACHDFPDVPALYPDGAHPRACEGWVASYLGVYHATAARRGEAGDHSAWASHYLDIVLDVTQDFAYGPEDSAPGRGYRDTFGAMWQNPLRAHDVALLAELLRQDGALTQRQQDRATELLSAVERAWKAEFWDTGIQPTTGITFTILTAADGDVFSLGGRSVVSRVPWALRWDADDRNSPAEEVAWMGAAAMLSGRMLSDRLSDADDLYEAGRHYIDFALVYNRRDTLRGGVVRTLSSVTEGGPYGQRRFWLKNHAADAPAIPYVGAAWYFIGTALIASREGEQRPWPSLAPDDDQWQVMLSSAEESLRAPDGTFLVDLAPGGGIGYNLSRFPAWFTECGEARSGVAYTHLDGNGRTAEMFVSEIGHPAGFDLLSTGWPIMRIAAARGDRRTYALWESRVRRVLDEYMRTPPDPSITSCKFAPYVSANEAYHWARWLTSYTIAYLGLSGFEAGRWEW